MRSRTGTVLVPLALSLLCTTQVASSQTGVQASSAAGSVAPGAITPVEVGSGRYAYGVTMYNPLPMTGMPYAAEITSTMIKTLPGGITITQANTTEKVWRDSQGRTRTERRIGTQLTPGLPPPPTVVDIRDLVAGIGYVLDQTAQIAYRVQLAQRPTPSAAVLQITATTENWSSKSLGVPVLMKRNDPRSGESTSKYTNINLVNPDFSLFQPPADYQIVDIDGPAVTIRMN